MCSPQHPPDPVRRVRRGALAPAAARARRRPGRLQALRTAEPDRHPQGDRRASRTHFFLDGTADAPVQIDCDDMQLFADQMEIFRPRHGWSRPATCCSTSRAATGSPPSGWSSTPRPAPARSSMPAGTAVLARQGRPQPVRHPGARRAVPRRRDPQDRPGQLPDRPRRLHHLRAADAALGDGRRLGHPQRRRPRAADATRSCASRACR